MAKRRQDQDFRPTRIYQPVSSPVDQFYDPSGLVQQRSFQNEMEIAKAFSGLSESLYGFAQTYTQAEIERGEREYLADAADSLKVRQRATEMIERHGRLAPWRVRSYLTIMGGREFGDRYSREAFEAVDRLSEPYGPNGELRTDETVAQELKEIADKLQIPGNFYVQNGFNSRAAQVNSEIMARVGERRVEKARAFTEGAVVTEVMAALGNARDPETMRSSIEERIDNARQTGMLPDGGRGAVIAAVMQEVLNSIDGPDPDTDRAEALMSVFQMDPDSPDLGLSKLPLNAEQASRYRDLQDRIRDVRAIASDPERFSTQVRKIVDPVMYKIMDAAALAVEQNPFYITPSQQQLRALVGEISGIPVDSTDPIQGTALASLARAYDSGIREARQHKAEEAATMLQAILERERLGDPPTDEEMRNLHPAVRTAVERYRESGYNGANARITGDFLRTLVSASVSSTISGTALTASESASLETFKESYVLEMLPSFESQMRLDPSLREMVERGQDTSTYIKAKAQDFFAQSREGLERRLTEEFIPTTGDFLASRTWTSVGESMVQDMVVSLYGGEPDMQGKRELPERTPEFISLESGLRSSLRGLFAEKIENWRRGREPGQASLEYLTADLPDIINAVERTYRQRLAEASEPPVVDFIAALRRGQFDSPINALQVQNTQLESLPNQRQLNSRNQAALSLFREAETAWKLVTGDADRLLPEDRGHPLTQTSRAAQRKAGYFQIKVPKAAMTAVVDGRLVSMGLPYRTTPDGKLELTESWAEITGREHPQDPTTRVTDRGDHYTIYMYSKRIPWNAGPDQVSAEFTQRLTQDAMKNLPPASPQEVQRFMTALSLGGGLPIEDMRQGNIRGVAFRPGLPPRDSATGISLGLGAPSPQYYLYGTDEQFLQMMAELESATPNGLLAQVVNDIFDNQITPRQFIAAQTRLRRSFSLLSP